MKGKQPVKTTEAKVVNEIVEQERTQGLYAVKYLLGKKARKYGTVWRDNEHLLIVWANNSEHARRLAVTSVRKNVNAFETKIQVSVRDAYAITL